PGADLVRVDEGAAVVADQHRVERSLEDAAKQALALLELGLCRGGRGDVADDSLDGHDAARLVPDRHAASLGPDERAVSVRAAQPQRGHALFALAELCPPALAQRAVL